MGSAASGSCIARGGERARSAYNLRVNIIKALRIFGLALVALSVLCASNASAMTLANVIDLRTTGATGTVNDALFYQDVSAPTGTGSYGSFLRLQNSPIEEAFNTDYRSGGQAPLDAKSDPNFTRSLTIGELQTVHVGTTDYYAFSLDIDEPNAGAQRYLSLDQLKLYTADTGDLADLSTATLRWNMDDGMESTVYLDGGALSPGNGADDMQVLIPKSAFAGVDPNKYLYLYSKFGATGGMGADNYDANASFEEWSALTTNPPTVPEPSMLSLLGCGVLGILATRRRRKS